MSVQRPSDLKSRRVLSLVGNNEAPSVCSRCGQCCESIPGILSPEDVGAPDTEAMRARLVEMLSSGRYAIDWWEGDPLPGGVLGSVEYVRPAVKGHEHKLHHPSWGGVCTFLAYDGCVLSFVDRPHNCRALVPNAKDPGVGCLMADGLDKEDYVLMWIPYGTLLAEIACDVKEARNDAE